MPTALAQLAPNESATIVSFEVAREISTRLASLGLTPGAEVDMAQNYGHGPLIITVRGTRVALGRVEADRILVSRSGHE